MFLLPFNRIICCDNTQYTIFLLRLTKRSWFGLFGSGNVSANDNSALNPDQPFTLIMNDRTLNSVKADLIHAFLTVS